MKQSDNHKQDVIDYYDSTRREYRILWKNNDNLGIHFGYYDEENLDHNSAVTNINRKLAEVASISANDFVLDAGCGVGGTCIWLARNIGCRADGITIVPWQVKKGRELIKEYGLDSKVRIFKGDFANTGRKNGTYDVFLGLESIVHAEDKVAVLKEAYRLLRQGGRLVICEYMLRNSAMKAPDAELIQRWLDGWAMPSLLSDYEYRKAVKDAGFKTITFYDWTEQAKPSFHRLDRFIKKLMPVRKILRALRIVNYGQIANLEASNAQMRSLERGLWRYKALVATK